MDLIAQDPAFFMNLGIVGVMFLGFYFLILRPQKKEDKKRELFLGSLKKGNKIVTAGGLYGVLVTVGEEKVTVRIAEKVEVELTRSAIVRFQDPAKQELLESESKKK